MEGWMFGWGDDVGSGVRREGKRQNERMCWLRKTKIRMRMKGDFSYYLYVL